MKLPSHSESSLLRHAWLLPILLLWGIFFWRSSFFWGREGYYFLGWLVPFLSAYFLWSRWRDAPAREETRANGGFHFVAWGAALGALLALWLGETMPFWRPLLYLQAAFTVVAMLAVFGAAGGMPWLRHFFPLCFFVLIGLPWPESVEGPAVHRLTLIIADLTEGALNLLGFGAEAIGNQIHVQGQVVEVGDACSGIRSFQGLLMIGLTIGELYRMRWNRISLVLAAFLVSFPLNVFRALTLSIIVVESGWEAYDTWHDPLGAIVYALGCLVLLGLAHFLPDQTPKTGSASGDAAPARPGMSSKLATLGLSACLLVGFIAVQGWFLFRESPASSALAWRLDPPSQEAWSARSVRLNPAVYDLLNYDTGAHYQVLTQSGLNLELFDFLYASGTKGLLVTEYHRPDVCMAQFSEGAVQAQSNAFAWEVGGKQVHVGGYHITYPDGQAVFAFQGVWIAGDSNDGVQRYRDLVLPAHNRLDRFRTAWRRAVAGRREFPIQVFLIATHQAEDLPHAWELCVPALDAFFSSASPIDTPNPTPNHSG